MGMKGTKASIANELTRATLSALFSRALVVTGREKIVLNEPLAKRLVLSGLGALVGASREALMLHFVALQRQIGGCRRTSP